MSGEMGTFRVDVEIENPVRPGEKRVVRSALVDTGAELSWFPRDLLESLGIEAVKVWHFRQADGTALSRWTGGVTLGSRSLEGLNLRIDPVSKGLVDAGPAPAAVAWQRTAARQGVWPRLGGAPLLHALDQLLGTLLTHSVPPRLLVRHQPP